MKPRTLMLYFGNTVLKYSFGVLNNAVVTEQVGVVHDKLLQKGFPLSVSGGSPPPHTHLLGS